MYFMPVVTRKENQEWWHLVPRSSSRHSRLPTQPRDDVSQLSPPGRCHHRFHRSLGPLANGYLRYPLAHLIPTSPLPIHHSIYFPSIHEVFEIHISRRGSPCWSLWYPHYIRTWILESGFFRVSRTHSSVRRGLLKGQRPKWFDDADETKGKGQQQCSHPNERAI